MANRSKNIGKRYETEVAEAFTSWWGEKFVRTPASGALRWRNQHWIFGDLVPPESFPCVVECKFNAEIDLDEVFRLTPNNGKLTYWWYWQTLDATRRAREVLERPMVPMLVYRTRGRKNNSRIVLDSVFTAALLAIKVVSHMRVEIPQYPSFSILRLDEFFQAYPRHEFEKLLS